MGGTPARAGSRDRSAARWVAIALAVAVPSCGSPAPAPTPIQRTPPATEPPAGQAACIASARGDIDARLVRVLCSEMQRTRTPGAVVAIVTSDGEPLAFSAGVRCRGQPEPVVPTTPFRIGSITKSLLATAVVRHRTNALQIDSPVRPLIAGLSAAYVGVTWRQLLDHTAGLPDTEPTPSNAGLSGSALAAALSARPPLGPPGAAHHYANAGYILVGMALQTRTGRPPLEEIRDVVAPHAEHPHPPIAAHEHRDSAPACGHLGDAVLAVTEDIDALAAGAQWTFPAGGVVLDAPTLARTALASIVALTPDRGPIPTGTPPWQYALGMRRRLLPGGHRLWFHAGITGDFAADLHVLPDEGVAVVVLGNAGRNLRATSLAALAHAAPGLSLGPAAVDAAP